MLNVHELERRWLRYKIRQYLPYGIGGASLLILLLVIAIWTFSDEESETPQPMAAAEIAVQPKPAQPQPVQPQPVNVTPQIPPAVLPDITPAKASEPVTSRAAVSSVLPAETVPVIAEPEAVMPKPGKTANPNNEKVVLKPSFDFLKTIERTPEPAKPAPKPTAPKKIEPAVVEEVYAVPTETAPQRDPGIKINRKFTQQEIDDAVNRFKKRKSPALGLFLSRHFYDTGDYEKAYNYALQTNRIDSRSEESWMIFAKAQYKLGQKKNALKTLKAYVQQSGSAKAHMLLNAMQNGNFQ